MSRTRSHRFSRAGDAPPAEGAATPLLLVQPSVSALGRSPEGDIRPVDDLGVLGLVVRAGERMDEAADLDELWAVIGAQAARVLGARAKVMQWTGSHWVAVDGGAGDTELEEEQRTAPAIASSEDGGGGGVADSPTVPRRVTGHARSVLVTTLDCSALKVPTRLVWTSTAEDAFSDAVELAAEFTRFAGGAVRRTHDRVHLRRAVTARHRIGQAQGILMAQLQLSAAEAFDLLHRRSQNLNVKLNAIADHVIATGDLDSAVGATPRRAPVLKEPPGSTPETPE